jgi:methylenetetrahydrofolate reductase (NADPH)
VRSGPDPAYRSGLARLLARPRFEIVPGAAGDRQMPFLPPGATVSVTSSPRRGLEPTLLLCERLSDAGFAAVPHLSARLIEDAEHLARVVRRIDRAGIRDVFVVGGDSPFPAGPFDSALSVLRALADIGHAFERLGVAGYPERHPLASEETLAAALLAKQPFAAYVVTQICFDPAVIFSWIGRMRREGMGLPVYIGMPGAVNRLRLLEVSLRVGVGDSVRYLRKHGSLVARLVRRGGYRPDTFTGNVSALLDRGAGDVIGFHINTFNQVESTERWRRGLLARYGTEGLPAS